MEVVPIYQIQNQMKNILSLILALTFGLNASLFAQAPNRLKRIGLYTMNVGEVEAVVISDGHLAVNPVQAEFAQRTDSSEIARTLKRHFASVSEIDLAMNILLLKKRDRVVLIDAGAGYVFGSESGRLATNLRYMGNRIRLQTLFLVMLILTISEA